MCQLTKVLNAVANTPELVPNDIARHSHAPPTHQITRKILSNAPLLVHPHASPAISCSIYRSPSTKYGNIDCQYT